MTFTIHGWHIVVAAVALLLGGSLYLGKRPPQGMFGFDPAIVGVILLTAGLMLAAGFIFGNLL